MYCKYCGSEIDNDAEFCPVCGRSQDNVRHNSSGQPSHHKGGRYQQKKRKKHIWPFFLLIIIFVVCIGVLIAVLHKDPVKNAIHMVQEGYLGEYTDLSVKKIMDRTYGETFDSSEWSGYISNSDTIYVNAAYFNKDHRDNGVFIEFTVLSKDHFKVSSIHDPNFNVTDSLDRVFLLNMIYLAALAKDENYSVNNEDDLIQLMQNSDFISNFDHISLSSACYGATADYKGNRADIGTVYGAQTVDISMKDMLEFIGFFCEITDDAIAEETETATLPDETTEPAIESTNETQAVTKETQPKKETQPPKQPVQTEPTAVRPAADPDEAAEAISQVLRGSRDFHLNVPESTVNIYSIYKLGDYFCDPPMNPEIYMLTDLDHDGSKEAIVRMNIAGEEYAYIILRYQDEVVYGFYYHFEREQISSDGRVIRVAENGNFIAETFSFDHGNLYTDGYIVEDNESFMHNWTDVAEHYFEFGDPIEGNSYESDQSQNMGVFRDNPAAASQLLDVLQGTAPLILSYSGEYINLYEITKVVDYANDYGVLIPTNFTVVDMDQDGTMEVIAELGGSPGDPWRLILRYQDGAVYGYGFPFRGLNCISLDGRAEGSSGADNTDFFRLVFDKTEIYSDPICGLSAEEIWSNWVNVTWYEFNGHNISALVHE